MTCEETRPVLSWECNCHWRSTNAYVLKHKVYLPVHLLVGVISHVRIHLDDLKEEMLQMEALIAKEVKRQQLQQQQELNRKADEQAEEAKRPRVEVPAVQGAAPSTGGVPQFALTEEDFRRIATSVTRIFCRRCLCWGSLLLGLPRCLLRYLLQWRCLKMIRHRLWLNAWRSLGICRQRPARGVKPRLLNAEGLKKDDDRETPGDSGKGSE